MSENKTVVKEIREMSEKKRGAAGKNPCFYKIGNRNHSPAKNVRGIPKTKDVRGIRKTSGNLKIGVFWHL